MADEKIICRVRSKTVSGTFAILLICFLLLQIIAIPEGTALKTLPIFICIYVGLASIWYMQLNGTYIVADLSAKTIQGVGFFFPARRVPIAAITHIGARGAFASWTVMELTYIATDGKKKKGGFGAREVMDEESFQKVLKALVEIDPELHIPPELMA